MSLVQILSCLSLLVLKVYAQGDYLPSSLSPIIKECTKSVVSIDIEGKTPATPLEIENNSVIIPERKFSKKGSGVIINAKEGIIVTNAHLVEKSDEIYVKTFDQRKLKATFIGSDENTDLAVIKVEANNLHEFLPIKDNIEYNVGDFVVAIGNPFVLNITGTSQSASFGIISAINRSDTRANSYDNYIQTDAAVNPGNSGGALININGDLIGITSSIIVPGKGIHGNIGISLAIPVNVVSSIVNQIIKYGEIQRGMIGIIAQKTTEQLLEAFDLPKDINGAIISQVNPNTPAAMAKLQVGDLITKINNEPVSEHYQVRNIIGILRADTSVELEIYRDGKYNKVSLKIENLSKYNKKLANINPLLHSMTYSDFTEESSVHGLIEGVVITNLLETSPMFVAGLLPGDIIVEANRQKISNIESMKNIVAKKGKILIRAIRGPSSIYFVVE